MSAKQGYSGNKVRRLCTYALLCAVCMIIGYIESLFELSFIAPGVKLGLANAVSCVLIFTGDIKGAFYVNLSRILLSAFLFSSPVSLAFALSGGVVSLIIMALLSINKSFSVIGISIAGGAAHNTAQCIAGLFFVGKGVLYYLPVLLITGALSGAFIGFLSLLILKRIKGEKNV